MCRESAFNAPRTRQHHERRLFHSMITDVLYLDEVEAVPALAGWAAASSSVEEETPRRSGPFKPEPTQTRPKQGGSKPASPRIASAAVVRCNVGIVSSVHHHVSEHGGRPRHRQAGITRLQLSTAVFISLDDKSIL
ncbi:unnamed protein product [Pleuronectes platessa]|uniref:Uncharacterized protein n=1 Tax=Pleuronectes platessa TaxID=8262 RepID=A0A9N7VAA2_PLEPL|nr:unnamed protein product [Pleuronectes platessa]